LPYLLDAIVTRLVARQAGVTEQTLGALTSESVPALRAYLWGRAEYRRGHESEAVQHFAHALEIDSGFALAALDLVVATGQVIGTQALCPSPACLTSYFTVGYRNTWPESDQLRLTRAVQLAWTFRDKLSPRDRPLLAALRGEHYPAPSTARELLAALQRAAVAAPDRVETQYLLGTLLLYQGPAMGIGDSRARAGAAFRRALELDPAYAAPIAGLVEVAAFDGDATELRRAGALYLAHDSTGATAAYIRWRVAAGLNDEVALSLIRARFDSLATSTLQRIAHASQMTGVALADADRAMALIVERAADPLERRIALGSAYMLAMNRGRPREAAALMTRRSELGPPDKVNLWTWTTMAALYWGGDTAVGQASARARAGLIARDTTHPPHNAKESLELSRHMTQQALWDVAHGDTARAVAAIAWLRVNANPVGADFVDVLLATATRRSDADTLRARLDSMALEGCCSTDVVHWMNFVDALAHEKAGSDADALRAVRRGIWRYPPQLLSTFLREEGRLAAGLGDAPGAIRAYRHYLALRSDPEPELKPEADSVRAELARLERRR
jgi:tetratricopeptide (TPR) repeat protein